MLFIIIFQCVCDVTGEPVGKKLILNGTGEITSEIVGRYTPTLIEAIEIGYGPEIIGTGAFKQCTNLQSISISESVTTIKSLAFSKTLLKALHLPCSVKVIETDSLFYGSNYFESISIDTNNKFLVLTTDVYMIMTKLN